MKERIQKILSSEGIASRRQAENLIREGRIKVNGLEAILGMSISRHDLIEIDGKKIEISEGKKALRVLMYNKKIGEISTTKDSLDRPSVFQSLPKIINGKWISVGRLDINTSGLMLFTNDGKFANKLMHPSSNIEREYVARIRGKVETDHIRELLEGVNLEDGKASFSDIQPGRKGKTNQWFAMVIMEGRTREVRRMWESLGFAVSRLKRVRIGGLFLPANIKQGNYKELSEKEIKSIEPQLISQ
ncbi:MAG TPA: rRNA pseudouridine synthase [Gammaproteobacteria bacterium]|jgi:23S rRNA pseudouridine2605 synthase|nr:rRNA pseudouridine synthase [Gammaproteobacteria bacterium]HIA43028.1 rRNA pseudouridine synthase [Gammaproteobacteria bacterium]HIB75702.1 rRNA pseudouridine synthase [Gammaproteobacteria bacterium]HIG49304.1 rRNA pseudouridine synthase [Gammaproteobacteria bacterium]HIM21678.1 rRNA pseudouridine synthase [Gammaproteobacteria bacterium]|tara:strand:+ start:575 stop:1309 length:735 start_codon:yes stop_codon:yes gene_type:complete